MRRLFEAAAFLTRIQRARSFPSATIDPLQNLPARGGLRGISLAYPQPRHVACPNSRL